MKIRAKLLLVLNAVNGFSQFLIGHILARKTSDVFKYLNVEGGRLSLKIDNFYFDKFHVSYLKPSEYSSVINRFGACHTADLFFPNGSIPMALLALDEGCRYVLKIEIWHDPRKRNNLAEEAKIIKHLTDCCDAGPFPRFIKLGEINSKQILGLSQILGEKGGEETNFLFMISEFISGRFYKVTAKQLIESIISLQKLGVSHGDLKPDNIIVKNGQCYLIDFDQSILLSDSVQKMPILNYLNWLDDREQEHFSQKTWLRHFRYSLRLRKDFKSLLRDL